MCEKERVCVLVCLLYAQILQSIVWICLYATLGIEMIIVVFSVNLHMDLYHTTHYFFLTCTSVDNNQAVSGQVPTGV